MMGAGLVAKTAIQYLLNQPGFQITIADLFIHKAEELVGKRRHSYLGLVSPLDFEYKYNQKTYENAA
jgi:saccharopine dehydrogenase-like NADP-dependent oxidoreductase